MSSKEENIYAAVNEQIKEFLDRAATVHSPGNIIELGYMELAARMAYWNEASRLQWQKEGKMPPPQEKGK